MHSSTADSWTKSEGATDRGVRANGYNGAIIRKARDSTCAIQRMALDQPNQKPEEQMGARITQPRPLLNVRTTCTYEGISPRRYHNCCLASLVTFILKESGLLQTLSR